MDRKRSLSLSIASIELTALEADFVPLVSAGNLLLRGEH